MCSIFKPVKDLIVRHIPSIVGVVLSCLYLWKVVDFRSYQEINCFLENASLNEVGDFLAGTAGVLALLWLVLGYVQQGKELRQNTDEIKNQVTQHKEFVKQGNAPKFVVGGFLKIVRPGVSEGGVIPTWNKGWVTIDYEGAEIERLDVRISVSFRAQQEEQKQLDERAFAPMGLGRKERLRLPFKMLGDDPNDLDVWLSWRGKDREGECKVMTKQYLLEAVSTDSKSPEEFDLMAVWTDTGASSIPKRRFNPAIDAVHYPPPSLDIS